MVHAPGADGATESIAREPAAVKPTRFTGWPAAVAAAVGVMALYLFLASSSTLWDRDEPRFARATAEMIESGNYLYPTYNGELRADKPIMIYWLMSAPMRLLGQTETAARLFGPSGTALVCLLLYLLGRRFVSPAAGMVAMLMLPTSLLMLGDGTAATADAMLLAFTTASLAGFALMLLDGVKITYLLLIVSAFAGGLLTKGPVGVVVPLPAMAAALWLGRRAGPLRLRHFGLLAVAAVAAVGIFLAWGIPANNATHGDFARIALGRHIVGTLTTTMEHHGGGGLRYFLYLPYYVPIVLLGFFPWTLFLFGGISALAGGRPGGALYRAFAVGWIVPTFAFWSLMTTKLPHYILPVLPALALVAAGTVAAGERGGLTARDWRWLRHGGWVFGPLGVLLAAAIGVAPWLAPPVLAALRGPCIVVAVLVLTMTLATWRLSARRRLLASAGVLVVGMVLVQLALGALALPAVERAKVSPIIARAIRARTAPAAPVAVCGYSEPSLVFYLDRPVTTVSGGNARVWARESAPAVLVVTRRELQRIEQDGGPLGLEVIAEADGYNFAKGRPVRLLALGRQLPSVR